MNFRSFPLLSFCLLYISPIIYCSDENNIGYDTYGYVGSNHYYWEDHIHNDSDILCMKGSFFRRNGRVDWSGLLFLSEESWRLISNEMKKLKDPCIIQVSDLVFSVYHERLGRNGRQPIISHNP